MIGLVVVAMTTMVVVAVLVVIGVNDRVGGRSDDDVDVVAVLVVIP